MGIFNFLWTKEKKRLEKEQARLLSEMLEKQGTEYLKDLGEMATTLAHEIRNPLASIRAGAQRLEQKIPPQEPTRKYTHYIIREVDRLERIVKDLLQDMRVFIQQSRPSLQLVNLNSLLEEIIASLQSEIEQKQVHVQKNFLPSLPKTHLDPQLLTQVFLNLLKNAFEAMSKVEKKELQLSTGVNQNYLEVKISDTGVGIPEEIREKIFQPFFTTKQGGTGLGLAICERIIKGHQGKIFLEETHSLGGAPERYTPGGAPERYTPGGAPERYTPGSAPERCTPGTTFVIRLPLRKKIA